MAADAAVDELAEAMPEWWATVHDWRTVDAAPKPPGRNVAEHERHSLKVQFRLNAEERAMLEARADGEGASPNALAAQMVRDALRDTSTDLIRSLYVARDQLPEWARLRVEALMDQSVSGSRRTGPS
jgi:hypothetical protein